MFSWRDHCAVRFCARQHGCIPHARAAIRAAKLAIACALVAWVPLAQSAGYPERPIRMIVGFTPGGGTDQVARIVGMKAGEYLGQQIVIDNRPGAGGNIAAELAAKASPDGYSLVMVSGSFAVNPSLHGKLQYDPVKDFAPITQVALSQYILTVSPAMTVRTLKELIALAKARPRDLNYATAGNGSPPHLATELLKSLSGIEMVHVPYKGTAPLMSALLGNEVQLTFANMGGALPQIRAGRIRALAVSGARRSPAAPEVPTVAEAGVPGFEATGWYGVLAPAGTPQPVVTRLHAEIAKALDAKTVRDQLAAEGLDLVSSSSSAFAAYIREEITKWAKVVRFANMKLD
jgi:tripartite-type tricarboxylate transporter receptor subunit TctC